MLTFSVVIICVSMDTHQKSVCDVLLITLDPDLANPLQPCVCNTQKLHCITHLISPAAILI